MGTGVVSFVLLAGNLSEKTSVGLSEPSTVVAELLSVFSLGRVEAELADPETVEAELVDADIVVAEVVDDEMVVAEVDDAEVDDKEACADVDFSCFTDLASFDGLL